MLLSLSRPRVRPTRRARERGRTHFAPSPKQLVFRTSRSQPRLPLLSSTPARRARQTSSSSTQPPSLPTSTTNPLKILLSSRSAPKPSSLTTAAASAQPTRAASTLLLAGFAKKRETWSSRGTSRAGRSAQKRMSSASFLLTLRSSRPTKSPVLPTRSELLPLQARKALRDKTAALPSTGCNARSLFSNATVKTTLRARCRCVDRSVQ